MRIRLVVGVLAVAAAGIAVAVVVVASRGDDETETQAPPLELGFVLTDRETADALAEAERAYDSGDRVTARQEFALLADQQPQSIEARVGLAMSSWPRETLGQLEDLVDQNPDSALARLHFGLALFFVGREQEAEEQWREAEATDPDSPAAILAEDLLHPEMPPGRPFFIPSSGATPEGLTDSDAPSQLAELERRAEEGGERDWLLYGAVLQRLGLPISALKAYDRAVEVDSSSVEAQTAAAVVRFDKDAPAEAFGRLGPLAEANPTSPVVRFHLGLLLLWIGDVEESRRQLTIAQDEGPNTTYGREAGRLLARLEEVRTS